MESLHEITRTQWNPALSSLLVRRKKHNILAILLTGIGGIIDTLTTYDFKKRSEHVLKSFIHDAVCTLLNSSFAHIFTLVERDFCR